MDFFSLKKFGIVLLAALLFSSCSDERKAEKTGKRFLQCYYKDMDFEEAARMVTSDSRSVIEEKAEMVKLNPYAKDDLPDFQFKSMEEADPTGSKMILVYTLNRVEKELILVKEDGRWLVDIPGISVESTSSAEGMTRLSSGSQGGFASAVSGPIVYKKRKNKK